MAMVSSTGRISRLFYVAELTGKKYSVAFSTNGTQLYSDLKPQNLLVDKEKGDTEDCRPRAW
jgi:hypothetical protein